MTFTRYQSTTVANTAVPVEQTADPATAVICSALDISLTAGNAVWLYGKVELSNQLSYLTMMSSEIRALKSGDTTASKLTRAMGANMSPQNWTPGGSYGSLAIPGLKYWDDVLGGFWIVPSTGTWNLSHNVYAASSAAPSGGVDTIEVKFVDLQVMVAS